MICHWVGSQARVVPRKVGQHQLIIVTLRACNHAMYPLMGDTSDYKKADHIMDYTLDHKQTIISTRKLETQLQYFFIF